MADNDNDDDGLKPLGDILHQMMKKQVCAHCQFVAMIDTLTTMGMENVDSGIGLMKALAEFSAFIVKPETRESFISEVLPRELKILFEQAVKDYEAAEAARMEVKKGKPDLRAVQPSGNA